MTNPFPFTHEPTWAHRGIALEGLPAMGVRRDPLPANAAAAMKGHCHATNPDRATETDYKAILREAS